MRVVDPTPEDVRRVAENMREMDLTEFMAVSFCETKAELVENLVERYAVASHGFCFRKDNDTPVGIGAMFCQRPNVITMGFFATDDFAELAPAIARFVLRTLFPEYRAAGVHRIECTSIEGYAATHRWLELLGLKREGRFEGFGRNGEAFHQFAWVA